MLIQSGARSELYSPEHLRSLSSSGQNTHHFIRIGTGQFAAPSVGVGKPACVQVVNGFGDPGGAANQQDSHLLLFECQELKVERQNQRRSLPIIGLGRSQVVWAWRSRMRGCSYYRVSPGRLMGFLARSRSPLAKLNRDVAKQVAEEPALDFIRNPIPNF